MKAGKGCHESYPETEVLKRILVVQPFEAEVECVCFHLFMYVLRKIRRANL